MTSEQLDALLLAGAERLLKRATNRRAFDASMLKSRLRTSAEKYLLKHDAAADAPAINSFLDGLHADDLLLVMGCERGDQDAWNDLFEGYGASVRSAARSASANEAIAEDLAQSIWAELHGLKMRQDGKPAGKLGYYSGVGSLGGWLRAVVGQLAIDQHRKDARIVQTEEDADFDRLAGSDGKMDRSHPFQVVASPEDLLTTQLAASDIEGALARAISELTDEDRLLVKLYYFDGLRLREAGAVLGVHEATASRRLTRIHGDIRQQVETILMSEHGWTKAEAARSLAEAAEQLQIDVEPMLASNRDARLETSPAGSDNEVASYLRQ